MYVFIGYILQLHKLKGRPK